MWYLGFGQCFENVWKTHVTKHYRKYFRINNIIRRIFQQQYQKIKNYNSCGRLDKTAGTEIILPSQPLKCIIT